MKIFLDTSSLIKLYNTEQGTDVVKRILIDNKVTSIYLSELTKTEFVSALLKNARMKLMSEIDSVNLINVFEKDWSKYQFEPFDQATLDLSRKLTIAYGMRGLRTLDSLQLAVAVSLKNVVNLFVTSDILLQSFFVQEGLPV